jgi:hypothetical protein
MSLPTRQQRVLNQIDVTLSADPRLTGMFSTFTRLTALEAMPVTEAIYARLPRPAVLISVMAAVTVLTAVLLGVFARSPGCVHVPAAAGSATAGAAPAVARTAACRPGAATGSLTGR